MTTRDASIEVLKSLPYGKFRINHFYQKVYEKCISEGSNLPTISSVARYLADRGLRETIAPDRIVLQNNRASGIYIKERA